ncbi:flavin-containing monooxygenase [Nocardioides sp.]|uniref:flavin-containing monooxygenase n=1 Tax=Nocardioides sp. TaxID=35761 RepID=UPI00351721A0
MRDIRVVIIGAGFGGLGAARALREAGVEDIVVLERADEVGGVWRDNTYPNAACDVPSPLYSWSWAANHGWHRRYGQQPEILEYLQGAAAREGLLDLVVTGAEVVSCRFDDATGRWTVTTAAGDTYEADLLVPAVGQLSNPIIPDLPGRDSFAGPAFHSAQWRHDVDLVGQRVLVVGTGASAIQFVPGIVDDVAAMTVFQRSAPYVIPKPDQPYRGLHHKAMARFPQIMAGERRSWFWVTEKLNAALEGGPFYGGALLKAVEASWKAQLRLQVRDPGLRAKLVPDYQLGCKRILFSNSWYPALARPHVDVVTEAVSAVEPTGVRTADGVLHEADVLIWGTGFAATEFLAGIEVIGAGGTDLREVWSDGAHAYLGIQIPGFPNLACIYGPNTNLGGSSIITMLEGQAGYVAQLARRLQRDAHRIDVRPEVAATYDAEMQQRLGDSVWSTCSSWYRDGSRISTNWPGRVTEYRTRTADVDWDALLIA